MPVRARMHGELEVLRLDMTLMRIPIVTETHPREKWRPDDTATYLFWETKNSMCALGVEWHNVERPPKCI
jgi:hypothetical protein